jgi:uncharacterized protein YdhG (YjbR/CyaY superfamily)
MTVDPGSAAVSKYISAFPKDVQEKLNALRGLIRRLAPEATERISYRIPTYYLHGNLVHFAGYAKHIGFYPTPCGIANFSRELSRYKHAKGSVQFPLDEALPMDLIERIVRFRVEENRSTAKT